MTSRLAINATHLIASYLVDLDLECTLHVLGRSLHLLLFCRATVQANGRIGLKLYGPMATIGGLHPFW